MNRKQKKELRERQSTRQLMGISQLTNHGVKTAKGELVFFMLKPDNLSVLSPEGVRGRVTALADLLRTTPSVRLLAMDSKESFLSNKHFYQERLLDRGLRVRLAEQQDIKRLLAIYYQQDSVTEQFPDFDGEGSVSNDG
ncbi:MAG: hypothetical protein HDT35_08890 [Clostridiales bacterium]|nr:hypothetical protein [Clostridiales bacterium]